MESTKVAQKAVQMSMKFELIRENGPRYAINELKL